MNFGISTASLYPLETEKALQFLGENGILATEIFFNSPSELEPRFINELKAIKGHYGIDVVSVHPCGSVGEPYFLFSGYERRYRDSFEYYKKYYYAAAELGAKTVVLHGDKITPHISDGEYCTRLLEMNEAAEEFGVTISHENVNKFRAATVENVEMLKKGTDSKLKFTFDVKQSIRDGCGVDAMYAAMRKNIVNVHISDNNENNDCMLPGKGNFDFSLLFKELQADGYKGACLIEVYRHAYSDYSELFEAYDYVKNIHNNIDKVR